MRKCNLVLPGCRYFALFRRGLVLSMLLVILVRGTSQNISINKSYDIIISSARPEEVATSIDVTALHFKAGNNRINFGFAANNYKYIILKLNSATAVEDQYLSVDNTSLDTVSFYRLFNNGTGKLLYRGGALVAFDDTRSYVWHTARLEISHDPSYYLIALKAPQKNINVTYEILGKSALEQKYQHHDRVIFFYTGTVCLIIAIIGFAFFLFRKKVFAVYLGYIACISFWIISHYGYVFPFLYPHLPLLNEIAKPVSSLGGGFFLILLLNIVFRQRLQAHVWLQRLIKGMLNILPSLTSAMLLLLIPGLAAWIKSFLIIAWHAGLILSIGTIVYIPFRFIRRDAIAKIFSISMFIVCIMAVIQLFSNSGYINNYFIEEHGLTMGSLLENSIMAFGLFYSLLDEKKRNQKTILALEQQQTETLKKLITVQDNERKRIAADLHDNLGPLLAALKINCRRIINAREPELQSRLVAQTESIIDDSIAEIRNVAHNLMPKGLSSNGLISTLEEYFESIKQLYNTTIIFNHQILSILNPELQMNMYRIICELVLNAAKHSNALLIMIRITANDKCVFFTIHDEGTGFEPAAVNQKRSLGLQSVESRVHYLKGKFCLKTEAGSGTVIDMEIPLQLHEAHVNGL